MKRIITAIGDSVLNNKLKENVYYNIIEDDVESDEKLLELCEREKRIDFIIIHNNIVKKYCLKELIRLIKITHNEINIIILKNETDEIEEEKKIYVLNDNIEISAIHNILSKDIDLFFKKYDSKVIVISGNSGVGKSMFSTFFAKNVENICIKTLLIDFDIENGNINTILKKKKKIKNDKNIDNYIISINKNFDILCYLNEFFGSKEQINFFNLYELIEQLKNEYSLIIIDTSSREITELNKRLFYIADNIFLLLEPNIIGIKKANSLLEIYNNDWKIDYEKIKIIINKANIYQISDDIIAEIFSKYEVIGKIKYSDKYNLMINKNVYKEEINNEYKKIINKFLEKSS